MKNAVAPAGLPPVGVSLGSLVHDGPSGLVVFLVALPLCLGISLASGAPLLAGIVTGIVGGLVVSWLSGSQLSVSGPAAGLTVIVLTAIHTLGSFQALLVATIVAGLLQVVMGLLKAGIIALYFPASVIRGMLAAIGLTLVLKQIPHFLGADTDYFEDTEFFQENGQNTFSAITAAAKGLSGGSVLVGVVSLALLLLWDSRWAKRVKVVQLVPGALVAVVVSLIISSLLKNFAPEWQVKPEHLVQLPVASSPGALWGALARPDWAAFSRPAVYTVAFTLAIVASLESLLCLEAVDKLDPWKRRSSPNRELIAQGIGNMTAGLLGGLPLTSVIVRSSANVNAGGRTRLASFVHGLLLLTSLAFLPQLLNQIPLSALAAVLLMVGFKLTMPALYRAQWRLGWQQFLPFIVTIVAILFTDLLKGVAVGLAVGFFFLLKTNSDIAYFPSEDGDGDPDTLHLKLAEHVTFLNKASIVRALDAVQRGTHVVLDGTKSRVVDHDVLEAIENFRQAAPGRGIKVELRGIRRVELAGH